MKFRELEPLQSYNEGLDREFSEDVRAFLQTGGNIEKKDKWGRTLFMRAASSGFVVSLMLLARRGADVNTRSLTNETPLTIPRAHKSPRLVKRLLELGTDPNVKGAEGIRPVSYARSKEVMKLLVQFGSKLDDRETNGNLTIIDNAMMDPVMIPEVARYVDIDARNYRGHTRLMYEAITSGFELVVKPLVKAGADVNARDPFGTTVLTHALRGGFKPMASELLYYGAHGDKKLLERYNLTEVPRERVKAFIAQKDPIAYISELLASGGWDIDARNAMGWTPLLEASVLGQPSVVAFLMSRGADVSIPSLPVPQLDGTIRSKDLPTNKEDMVSYVEALPQNTGLYTPLMMACMNDHVSTCEVLLEGGVDVDTQSEAGFTALSLAIMGNNMSMVEALLNFGARTDIKSVDGYIPMMWASSLGYTDIVRKLLESGSCMDDVSRNLASNDILRQTITTASTGFGLCDHPDLMKLSSGKCVHITTDLAKNSMLRQLNRDIPPARTRTPRQSTGTCWFFTMINCLFISDIARKNSKVLRQNMILGRPGKRFPRSSFTPAQKKTLLRLNMMIQSIIDGEGFEQRGTMFRNNEDVVYHLHEHFSGISPIYSTLTSIYGGSNFMAIDALEEILGPSRLDISIEPVQFECDGYELLKNSAHEDLSSILPRKTLAVEYFPDTDRTILLTHCDQHYVLESAFLGSHNHAVAGITLGGEEYVVDSNIGKRKVEWKRLFITNEVYINNGVEFTFRSLIYQMV